MKNIHLKTNNIVLHNGSIKTIDGIVRGHVCFVEDVKNEKEYGPWCCLDEVEFIPITYRYLGKMGFELQVLNDDDIPIYILTDNGYNFYIDFITLQPTEPGFPISKVKIEYVHQLQNLYYAITGKELTIK